MGCVWLVPFVACIEALDGPLAMGSDEARSERSALRRVARVDGSQPRSWDDEEIGEVEHCAGDLESVAGAAEDDANRDIWPRADRGRDATQ